MPAASLRKLARAPSPWRQASSRSFDTSMPMLRSVIFHVPMLVIRGATLGYPFGSR